MTISNILFAIAVMGLVGGAISAMSIVGALQKRGVKINWLFLKLMILRYLNQYRNITRQETGKTGFLFYTYIFAMNLALIAALLGFFLR